MRKLTTEQFIARATTVHGSTYDYTNTVYVNRRTKVSITCNSCNTELLQWSHDHLNGHGCFKCNNETPHKYTTESFIEKSITIFGSNYTYELTKFTNIADKLTFTCNNCGSECSQKGSSHMNGHEACACYVPDGSGFSVLKPAILYYLSINNGEAYKIGITNRTVQQRFLPWELNKITTIAEWAFSTGREALKKEQEILAKFSTHKYTGDKLLCTGNTELFTHDILKLNIKENK